MIVLQHPAAAFTFWLIVATSWAMYGGFSLVIWYYTRSDMSALSAWLAFWLFVITSSITVLTSGQAQVTTEFFFALQRAAWIPAILIYWLIIDSGLRHGNGRLTKIRRVWRPWKRRETHD